MAAVPLHLKTGPITAPGLGDVRQALLDLGYTSDAIHSALHVGEQMPLRDSDIVLYERRLASAPGPIADVIALFAFGGSLPVARLRAALGSAAVDALIASAAIDVDGGTVTAAMRLLAHGDLYIASDPRTAADVEPDPLHVTGINAPAGLLAALTVRAGVGAALDLGTGNGIQALLAARHSTRVVATDVNRRALAFARFNAALNGITNIEFVEGNLFEPVGASRFDLVVTNPPYVISPDHDFVYRDSGAAPAALCREIVESLPDHLEPGGFATVLASWPIAADAAWSDEPATWLAPSVDAWLLHYASEDPLTHAAKWNQPVADIGTQQYADALDRWTRYDAEAAIDQIGFGALILRGRADSGGQLMGTDSLRGGSGSASEQIRRVFAAYDDRRSGVDPAAGTPRPATGHQLRQNMYFADGVWQLADATLMAGAGLQLPITLDAVTVQVIAALDGTRTAEQAAQVAAQACGIGPEDLDRLTDLVRQLVAELTRLGILERTAS